MLSNLTRQSYRLNSQRAMNFYQFRHFSQQKVTRPQTCFYKLLNVSAKADLKEIKVQYYKLAKKHHPDSFEGDDEEQRENSKELFKQITEAYAILSDDVLRKKYDRLIFGDSADNKEFDNEEAYSYWSDRKQQKQEVKESYQEMQDRVREKLKNFKDYDDFLKAFENHREKSEARTKLMREEGFKELNDKYGSKYDFWESA